MSDASSHRISVEEAAQRLGLSPDEVVVLRRSGKIRGYPDYGNWVFEESDVAELAAEMGIAAAPAQAQAQAQPVSPTEPETADRPADPSVEVYTLEELAGSDQPVSSALLIAALAARHETGFHEAAAVVDGFWDHLLDPRHYRQGRRSLNMPHFGSFSLKRTHDGQSELHFKSRPLTELRKRRASSGTRRPSTDWIDHWQQHPPSEQRLNALSLKRKLAVAIAEETTPDLKTTFLILWDLIETITGIMTLGGAEIRFAKRGGMKAHENHYSFRTYKRLTDTLPTLPEPQQPSRRASRKRGRQFSSSRRGSESGGTNIGCASTLFKVMFYVILGLIVLFINSALEGC